jgi:hypothetical protein
MLKKPAINDLRAAARISPLPDWAVMAEMIEGELQEIYSRMTDSHNTVVLHQLQGRAQALKDFRLLIKNSQGYLERMTK